MFSLGLHKTFNFDYHCFLGNQEIELWEGFKSDQRASVVPREIETSFARQERRVGDETQKFGEKSSFMTNVIPLSFLCQMSFHFLASTTFSLLKIDVDFIYKSQLLYVRYFISDGRNFATEADRLQRRRSRKRIEIGKGKTVGEDRRSRRKREKSEEQAVLEGLNFFHIL